MEQGLVLEYKTKETDPLQLYFLSHEPFSFKQSVIFNNSIYDVSKIEKVEVMRMPSMTILVSNSMTSKQQAKMFSVDSMDQVYSTLGLETGSNVMFLHLIDIKDKG
ncbi:MAG: Unknown protein [uncultured Sulfurovum sp.]|uniref:Uncharacterized protein n=1 Tax=uncultured Sulfurovum sp. TaxID=269237 RepID=A0A6S6SRZ7_9BACT|nr:MAG: Unknown protein [uncultured Sulfurovum sp.]